MYTKNPSKYKIGQLAFCCRKGGAFQFLDGAWRFFFGTIERIWSRNWWKNPSAEIERIDQKVKDIMKSEKIREQILVLE